MSDISGLTEYLNQLKERTEDAIGDYIGLQKIRDSIFRLFEDIQGRYAQASVNEDIAKMFMVESVVEAVFIEALGHTQNDLIRIFTDEFAKAVSNNQEFNSEWFLEGFREVIQNAGEAIKITLISAKTAVFRVEILMDSIAGEIEEYSNAILEARAALRTKPPLRDPDRASEHWKRMYRAGGLGEIVHRRRGKGRGGKAGAKGTEEIDVTEYYRTEYEVTRRTRKEFIHSPAPWWKILNYGSATEMRSSWGGTAFPLHEPTHFLENSIALIHDWFNGYFKFILGNRRDRFTKEAKKLERIRKEWDDLIGLCAELLDRIDQLIRESEPITSDPPFDKETRKFLIAQEQIIKRVLKNTEASQITEKQFKRIESLAYRIAAGERINPKSGVRIGRNVRIRLLAIANQIKKEFDSV